MVQLRDIIQKVELRLADFYGFHPQSEASQHLVTRDELQASLGDAVARLPEFQGRGGVFLQNGEAPNDLFIGIHLDDEIRTTLEQTDPLRRLDDGNLDEFCVLVEEVSHFHLILNRATVDQGVSKLELEWQGEVDKLLVCAMMLKEQQGDLHLEPLARRLYDTATIIAKDVELYWEATRHAARFWRETGRHMEPLGAAVREHLRRTYRASWSDKLAQLEGQRRAS